MIDNNQYWTCYHNDPRDPSYPAKIVMRAEEILQDRIIGKLALGQPDRFYRTETEEVRPSTAEEVADFLVRELEHKNKKLSRINKTKKKLSFNRILSICKDEWQDFVWNFEDMSNLTFLNGEKNNFGIRFFPSKIWPDFIGVDILNLIDSEWQFVCSEDLLIANQPISELQLRKHLRELRYKYF